MGSTAITIPSLRTGPLPLVPKLGTSGASWTEVPTPWPQSSLTTPSLWEVAYSSIAAPISPIWAPGFISFKPTNIQQISAEEVNAFIQKNQQQKINNFNQPQFESHPKIITPIQPTLNQPQINANINPNINININPNIPIQTSMPPPMYPSPYPIIIPQNQNPQMMYGIPYGMYPPSGYQFPVQNQFEGYPNPQMEQKIDVKKEKK